MNYFSEPTKIMFVFFILVLVILFRKLLLQYILIVAAVIAVVFIAPLFITKSNVSLPMQVNTVKTNTKLNNIEKINIEKQYNLCKLSLMFESKGNSGLIANNKGDIGGKSYGLFQFNTKDKIIHDFVKWTKNKDIDVYNSLTKNLDKEFIKLSKENQKHFFKLQYEYTKQKYYDPVESKLNFQSKSIALKSVTWSTSVQHGPDSTIKIISKYKHMNDKDMINNIYVERSKVNIYFKSSSKSIKKSVANRFKQERVEALKMLKN